MFYVYFAHGYSNEQLIAECRTESAARSRAEEEFLRGSRDIVVVTETGLKVYEPQIDDEGFFVE